MASETPLSDVRFLTVAEVALIMRVSKMTVYRLVHSGELEAIRVGRSFRVPEAAVNQYLRGRLRRYWLSRPESGLAPADHAGSRPAGVRLACGRMAEVAAVWPGRPWGVPSRGPRAPRGRRMAGIGRLARRFGGNL